VGCWRKRRQKGEAGVNKKTTNAQGGKGGGAGQQERGKGRKKRGEKIGVVRKGTQREGQRGSDKKRTVRERKWWRKEKFSYGSFRGISASHGDEIGPPSPL